MHGVSSPPPTGPARFAADAAQPATVMIVSLSRPARVVRSGTVAASDRSTLVVESRLAAATAVITPVAAVRESRHLDGAAASSNVGTYSATTTQGGLVWRV